MLKCGVSGGPSPEPGHHCFCHISWGQNKSKPTQIQMMGSQFLALHDRSWESQLGMCVGAGTCDRWVTLQAASHMCPPGKQDPSVLLEHISPLPPSSSYSRLTHPPLTGILWLSVVWAGHAASCWGCGREWGMVSALKVKGRHVPIRGWGWAPPVPDPAQCALSDVPLMSPRWQSWPLGTGVHFLWVCRKCVTHQWDGLFLNMLQTESTLSCKQSHMPHLEC